MPNTRAGTDLVLIVAGSLCAISQSTTMSREGRRYETDTNVHFVICWPGLIGRQKRPTMSATHGI